MAVFFTDKRIAKRIFRSYTHYNIFFTLKAIVNCIINIIIDPRYGRSIDIHFSHSPAQYNLYTHTIMFFILKNY